MPNPNGPPKTGPTKSDDERAADYADGARGLERASGVGGSDQVQATVDAAHARGYLGASPDPTPREHYTVAGVTAGKPTPETDPAGALAAGTQAAAGNVTDQAAIRETAVAAEARDLTPPGVPPADPAPKA